MADIPSGKYLGTNADGTVKVPRAESELEAGNVDFHQQAIAWTPRALIAPSGMQALAARSHIL